jgi:hypothetical protein
MLISFLVFDENTLFRFDIFWDIHSNHPPVRPDEYDVVSTISKLRLFSRSWPEDRDRSNLRRLDAELVAGLDAPSLWLWLLHANTMSGKDVNCFAGLCSRTRSLR